MRLFFISLILLTQSGNLAAQSKSGQIRRVSVVNYTIQYGANMNLYDTLLKDTFIDLSITPADIFFSQLFIQYPPHLPGRSMLRNPTHKKECDWKNWPGFVKCYQYDKLNRVTEMKINGPGVYNGIYKYFYTKDGRVSGYSFNSPDLTNIYYTESGLIREIIDSSLFKNTRIYFRYQSAD